MSILQNTLRQMNFSQTESKIYEVCVHKSPLSASQISVEIGLNRATVYHAIHQLTLRGMLSKQIKNGITYLYPLNNIESLFDYEQEKLLDQKEILTRALLKHGQNKNNTNPATIETFSGLDGIRMALGYAFCAKKPQWDIIAPKTNFFSQIDESFAMYFMNERRRRKIKARSLWEKDSSKQALKKTTFEERNPRFMPKEYNGMFTAIMILYDSSVLIISSIHEMEATVIRSPSIVSLLRIQFNLIWNMSEKPSVK